MTSKHWTILLCLFPIVGTFAQTTHEPYVLIQQERGTSSSNVWVLAWADRPTTGAEPRDGHQWWHWYYERGGVAPAALPSLIMPEIGLQVAVTGTLEQAIADLRKLKAWSIPVTPRQFRLALLDIDVTPDNVESLLATIEDEKLRTAAQIEWRNATEIRRDHPLIAQIAPMLGGTDEMLDDLFLSAMEK